MFAVNNHCNLACDEGRGHGMTCRYLTERDTLDNASIAAEASQPRVGGWVARISDPEGLPVFDTQQGNAAYEGRRA